MRNKLPNNDPIRDKKPEKDKNFRWRRALKTLFIWVILFFGALYVVQVFNLKKTREVEIAFTEYRKFLDEDLIKEAVIEENDLHGVLKYEKTIPRDGRELAVSHFRTTLPFIDRDMVAEWEAKGVPFEFRKKSVEWVGYLFGMFPWILLIVLYVVFLRRFQGGGGNKGIFSFGKSRARLLTENTSKVTFKDVAGADEAKQELTEGIEFLHSPEKF